MTDKYIVATTNLMQDNTFFSECCLEKLSKISHVEVNREFNFDDKIGVAKNFSVTDGKLECEIQVVKDIGQGFFVPSISDIDWEIKNGIKEYHSAKLTSIGFVKCPSDSTLDEVRNYDG